MDLGRFDIILRTGLRDLMIRKSQYRDCRNHHALIGFGPLAKIPSDTHWSVGTPNGSIWNNFIYADGPKQDVVAAIALLKGGFYDPGQDEIVPTQDLLDALNINDQSPPFPPEIATWNIAEEALRQVTKTVKN
jgi:hypothetical protein